EEVEETGDGCNGRERGRARTGAWAWVKTAGNTATEENGGPRARVRAQGLSGSVLRALVGGCSASFAISAVDRCSLPHRVDRRKHGSSAEGSTALGIGEGQQYADPSVARVVRVVGHAEVAVGVAAHFDD